jgi:hypothetical protein
LPKTFRLAPVPDVLTFIITESQFCGLEPVFGIRDRIEVLGDDLLAS